jgi:hypothetical protein
MLYDLDVKHAACPDVISDWMGGWDVAGLMQPKLMIELVFSTCSR